MSQLKPQSQQQQQYQQKQNVQYHSNHYIFPQLKTDQITKLWNGYLVLFIVTTIIGFGIKFGYYISHGYEAPSRKLVKTWTNVKLIDRNMLLLPLIAILFVSWTLPSSKPIKLIELNIRKHFICFVLTKLILSTIVFYVFYFLFEEYANGFDPSSHLICAIIAYANWLQLCIFLRNFDIYLDNKYTRAIQIIASVLFFYQIYSLVFTVAIYHDTMESIHALTSGFIIVFLIFVTDHFSSTLYQIYQMITQAQFQHRNLIWEEDKKRIVLVQPINEEKEQQ